MSIPDSRPNLHAALSTNHIREINHPTAHRRLKRVVCDALDENSLPERAVGEQSLQGEPIGQQLVEGVLSFFRAHACGHQDRVDVEFGHDLAAMTTWIRPVDI